MLSTVYNTACLTVLAHLPYIHNRWASFEAEIVNALSQVDVAEAVRVYREEAYPNLIGRYIQSDAGGVHVMGTLMITALPLINIRYIT